MNRRWGTIGVLAAATAAALAGGSALAVAGTQGNGNGRAVKRQAVKRHAVRWRVVRRLERAGVHADVKLVRADGSTDAFAVDGGTVTAASGGSLTLLRRDGTSVTFSLASGAVRRGTVVVGRRALVFSRDGTAFRVRGARPFVAVPPTTPAAAKSKVVHLEVTVLRADGSTISTVLDRGQVTAVSATSLTLGRDDGVSVTFALNADTRIRGHLTVGGRALVLSRAGAAVRVFARPSA
ncbi:MAG TPA: hypothetical protein VFA44_00930 [Gaiellaceae bacterium]|nr:hypothetical protein [Gaiellaceae bacterium]HZT53042.1 hypothetical protein [Gaiellaceae bacterium]